MSPNKTNSTSITISFHFPPHDTGYTTLKQKKNSTFHSITQTVSAESCNESNIALTNRNNRNIDKNQEFKINHSIVTDI